MTSVNENDQKHEISLKQCAIERKHSLMHNNDSEPVIMVIPE